MQSIRIGIIGLLAAVALSAVTAGAAQAQVGWAEPSRPYRSENVNRWSQYHNLEARNGQGYWRWHRLRQGRTFHAPLATSWESEWYLRRNWSEDPSGRRYRAGEVEPPPSTINLPRPSSLQGTGTRSWY